jgi:peptidase E
VAAKTQRILAIGGVQMYPGSTDWPLHQFMLDLSGRERPRICMLATASGEDSSGLANFYATFARQADASHLDLFGRTVDDIETFLVDQDVIYVGGGNTANMLAIWRLHGVDKALKTAWEEGVVLAGWSAGANCWFDGSVTDSFGPNLDPLKDGLRFLPGSFCPHYDSEPGREPMFRRLVGPELPSGYAADDGVGLHFAGTELAGAVSARDDGRAFRVEPGSQTPLPVRLL